MHPRNCSICSIARKLADLPAPERAALIRKQPAALVEAIAYHWRAWAREAQVAPDGDWTTWLLLAGRGFGKTRTAAEWIREEVDAKRAHRIALVGATAADVRDTMIEGESGLLAIWPSRERPLYEPSKRKLSFSTGAQAWAYSAEEPDRLRGPQHDLAWCDELCAWQYPDATWDMLQFGLRLGSHPRQTITTTPRPTKLLREIMSDPRTVLTRGRTLDNAANLADPFIAAIRAKYAGTRLGRQELDAEVLDDNPGALFKRTDIENARVLHAPALERIVIAIDPAATSAEESDDTGIVAAGVATVDGVTHGYILHDLTCHLSPQGWATKAVRAYHQLAADRVIGEANNGGDMIESVIRSVDASCSYRKVTATRGKAVRAEPVAALYEQCIAKGTLIATALGDVPIELVAAGDLVWTRAGLRRVQWAGQTGLRDTLTIRAGSHLVRCTDDHPVFVHGRGFIHARHLVPKKDIILSWNTNAQIADARSAAQRGASHALLNCVGKRAPLSGLLSKWKASAITSSVMVTGAQVGTKGTSFYTERFGSASTARSLLTAIFTTLTAIKVTTPSKIWPLFLRAITRKNILGNPLPMLSGLGSQPRESSGGPVESPQLTFATSAKLSSCPPQHEFDSVPQGAIRTIGIDSVSSGPLVPVYDLTIEDQPEYFAGGILVHNCRIHHVGQLGALEDELCEWDPADTTARSPNRLDAMVWAITDLMLGEGYAGYAGYLTAGAEKHRTQTDAKIRWRD